MALSDSPRRAVQKSSRRRAVGAETNRHWSDAQKIEAVTLWLTMGNLRLVAATLNIPEMTMRAWRKTDWWKSIAEEIKLQEKIQFSATAQRVIAKSLEVIQDRLEGGDYIYDQKQGQLIRKPVSVRDATAVASAMIDKKVLLDKSEFQQETAESIEQRLEKLMNKFAAMVPQNQPVSDVIFVEGSSAEDEEREEGLLLRQGVSEETGTGEEPGGEECSEEDH